MGRDSATVFRALEIESTVRARGAYPVYSLAHLANLTGASWRLLRDIVARRRDPYLDISRPKRNGRTRSISSPEPVLMDVQRWLLHKALCACEVHPSSYAYRRHHSIVDCARMHIGAKWLVKLDIQSFFDSVGERRVYRTFAELGYPRLLSLEFARLCTRTAASGGAYRDYRRYHHKAPYAVTVGGVLPQGAPTSGTLANVAMFRVDTELSEFALAEGLVYTRYSDDLTFSAGPGFSRQRASAVVNGAVATLGRAGFRLHRAKTRIVPPGARHIVLGLLVTDEHVRLLPAYKRRLEIHVRGVEKFGIAEHAQHRKFDSILSMINHVDGCIAFAASVEPTFAGRLRDAWSRALRDCGYPTGFTDS
jgi:RNA-directed DNA polymerase